MLADCWAFAMIGSDRTRYALTSSKACNRNNTQYPRGPWGRRAAKPIGLGPHLHRGWELGSVVSNTNGTGRGFLQGHTRGAITPAPFVQTTSGCRATVPRTQPPGRPPPLVQDQPSTSDTRGCHSHSGPGSNNISDPGKKRPQVPISSI